MSDSKTFLERVAEHNKKNEPPSTGPVAPVYVIPAGDDRSQAYARAALREESADVANAAKGTRNDTLNRAAFKLASLVDAGHLDATEVTDTLTAAARQAGLSDNEIRATLQSGIRGSAAKVGPRQIPDTTPAVMEVTSDHFANADRDADSEDTEGAEDGRSYHQMRVQQAVQELEIREDARQLFASKQAAILGQHMPTPESLTELLAVPDDDAQYRIADLLPVGARVLLAAQYKAGKTTMMANLLRSLADSDPFLGRYTITPITRVTVIDTELDKRMLRRWLRTQGIRNTNHINVISLRGKLSTFDILDTATRARWAEQLAGSDMVILDCLRPCIDALGLSEDKDAGKFLVAFDALLAEAGVQEAVVVHHMGHSEERSRGDSRLLDWPDVLWKIVRDRNDDGTHSDNADRYFSAHGRDVNIAEGLLDYTPENGSLVICGGSRSDKKARGTFDDIIEILSDPSNSSGLSFTKFVAKLKAAGNSRDGARKALRLAVEDGLLLVGSGANQGRGGGDLYTLNPSRVR